MDIAQTRAALTNTPFFSGLGPKAIDAFAQSCHQKTLGKGHELFSAHDPANSFFLIIEGWIKLYRISRNGEETIIRIFGPGETFAEAAVFQDNPQYPVNAQAAEETILLEIPRKIFIKKIQEDSSFALSILAKISSRQHYLIQQLEQIAARNAPQRIGVFLLDFCKRNIKNEIILPYDKHLISARLNIKPETFSRAISKLEKYGVSVKGRIIFVENPDSLAKFCDYDWSEKPC